MYIKLPSRDLNPDPYLPYSTRIYTCEVPNGSNLGHLSINSINKKIVIK